MALSVKWKSVTKMVTVMTQRTVEAEGGEIQP
jgi:hypothetical protein